MSTRSVVIQMWRLMLPDLRRELPETSAVNTYWKISGELIADE